VVAGTKAWECSDWSHGEGQLEAKVICTSLRILLQANLYEQSEKMQLIGYKNEFFWAIFDLETRRFTCGEVDDTPRKFVRDDGFGSEYSPFLELDEECPEFRYCVDLSQWWGALQRYREERNRNCVRIGEDDEIPDQSISSENASKAVTPVRRGREHRLLGDLKFINSRGIFIDCTVRVCVLLPRGFVADPIIRFSSPHLRITGPTSITTYT